MIYFFILLEEIKLSTIMTKASQEKFIDIKSVIKKKNKTLAALIPNFIIKYLKRVIHEDGINDVISRTKHLQGLSFVKAVLKEFKAKYEVIGEENIPKEGRYIFVANHPLGGLDGIVFTDAIAKHHKNVKFIVNDILLNITNFEDVFVPVNKHGKQSLEYVKNIERLFASDDQVLFFPAGLCSRKVKGEIIDLEWKKTFILKAIKHKRDIVPVYFEGKNSKFFYNLARFRKALRIKANIEMMFLPDEMFKQKGKNIRVHIGKPISYQSFTKEKSALEWAKEVKDTVYNIPENKK